MERCLGLFAGLALMVCVADEMRNDTDHGLYILILSLPTDIRSFPWQKTRLSRQATKNSLTTYEPNPYCPAGMHSTVKL